MASSSPQAQDTTAADKKVRFKLLCWNLDGLDRLNTVARAHAVCSLVKTQLPHAIILQEVVDHTWAEITRELGATYHCYCPDRASRVHYYVAILVHRDTVKVTGDTTCLMFTSNMGRQLLQLPISFAGADIMLMTAHLESTESYCLIRERQLRTVFDIMQVTCAKRPVSCLFGGDLNILDEEVRSVGVPPGMVDVWEACGSSPVEQVTFDMTVNDNRKWPARNKPQRRIDRLYLMTSSSAEQGGRGLSTVLPPCTGGDGGGGGGSEGFRLVGKERVKECDGRFPSDHWGMWAEFELL